MLIKSKTEVDKLTKRVENLYDQRQADEDKREQQQARLKIIRQAPKFVKTDFWCHKHGDCSGIAVKVVFGSLNDLCAYYESIGSNICREDMACCKGLRRRITDKLTDPYYRESAMLKLQRKQQARDLLQPRDYGFTTLYGDPNKKKWAKMDSEERANFKKKISLNV